MTRDWLGVLHLWLGVALCVPLVALGLTGTLLVFEKPVTHLFSPAPHQKRGQSQPIAAIVAAARQAAPDGQKPSLYLPPAEPGGPATVRFSAAAARGGPGFGAQVAVDPVTLATTTNGVTAIGGFMRQVHRLHGNLLMSGRDGRAIIGWLGVVMLAMGFSGLCLWWPRSGRWTSAFGVSKTARGLRFHRELHGAVGIWGLAVFIVVSFSGVFLAFPETVAGAMAVILPGADARTAPTPRTEPAPGAEPADADRAAVLAASAVPGGVLRSVGLPLRPDQPYRVSLAHAGDGDGAPSVTVFVDPWKAAIAEIRDPAAYPAGQRIAVWQHALHAGAGLGMPWHILVGLSGLLPAMFATTGMSMWLIKRRARRQRIARTIPAAAAAE